jgi:FAD binding domain/Berberine and berberine like
MNRTRALTILGCAAAFPVWARANVPLIRSLRRRRPGDPQWPSKAKWAALNRAVGGNLVPVASPISDCTNVPGDAACAKFFTDVRNPYYIGDSVGVTQTLGWVDAWKSEPSVYAVAARNAAHIAAAVNFARENDLRLVVKGGGHSYLGTSNAPDSLLIWTRHMNEIVMHDAFVPRDCNGSVAPQLAVTMGAGAIWGHAYDAVTTKGARYVQGGGCVTVGVAGLIQSGGFGSHSKHYGSAAAALLEAEVVTADGEIRIANACTNPDLFWALKGGGGGSFGVVSKVTVRVRELPEFFGGVDFRVKADSEAAFHDLLVAFVDFYAEHLFNEHWGEQATMRPDNTLNVSMVFNGLDAAQANATWKPFLDWIVARPKSYTMVEAPSIGAVPAQNWWDEAFIDRNYPSAITPNTAAGAQAGEFWWKGDGDQVGWFLWAYESLWLPSSLLDASERSRLADALFNGTRHFGVSLHFNKGLAGAPSDAIEAARNTATNPEVLTAFALAISADAEPPAYPGVTGHEPNVADARTSASRIDALMNELRTIAPANGSYVSESNYFQKNWQQSYWGTHYPRLAAIKKKYDSSGLFFVYHGVGSEAWTPDGFTRLT